MKPPPRIKQTFRLPAELSRDLADYARRRRVAQGDVVQAETLALFVRFWLTAVPPLPDTAQAAAQAKGRERFEGFVETLGRRLAKGRSFADEIVQDVPATTSADPDEE